MRKDYLITRSFIEILRYVYTSKRTSISLTKVPST